MVLTPYSPLMLAFLPVSLALAPFTAQDVSETPLDVLAPYVLGFLQEAPAKMSQDDVNAVVSDASKPV